MPGRHLVVFGGSAGAIEALIKIVSVLPDNFPAAMCVAIHQSPATPSVLPHLLRRAGSLPAFHAANGERLAPARIYVAPPDHHLVFENGETRIVQGPRENGHRPSIDVLFRSAAHTYNAAVIGVVLSGMLDDGTAGLGAVKSHGGRTIVQDPGDALFPDMPRNALIAVEPEHVLAADEIASELVELVNIPAPFSHVAPVAGELEETGTGARDDPCGRPAPFGCPQCGGALFEIKDRSVEERYRCRVGHAYSPRSLLDAQKTSLEDALWAAVRSLEEQADLCKRLAVRSRRQHLDRSAERLEARAAAALRRAEVVHVALRDDYESDGNGPDYDTESNDELNVAQKR
jgi:two-component system, chemotaxis family, protein-glutamate methylesterase/glutaminase